MEVQLIDYTGKGSSDPARAAANLLVFTKSTRLNMSPSLMAHIEAMSDEKIDRDLAYMAKTIPSSWEFVHYSFLITGVTRAFTHQFVRTRTGSYAQQTMRVLDVSGWDYGTGPSLEEDGAPTSAGEIYHDTMATIAQAYDDMIEKGAKIEDARGVLPTNIKTNIAASFSLRTLADTFRKRASTRTQGEYREVMDAMKAAVIEVHPWAALFFEQTFDCAAKEVEDFILGLEGIPDEKRTEMIKRLDQMRTVG